MKIIIETERLKVREFNSEDFESVFELNSNLAVQKYTGDILLKTKE